MLNCYARSLLYNPFFLFQVSNVTERSYFSKAQLSFTSECGRSCILDLNGISYGDGVYLFIPQTQFDCSSFVRYQSVGYASVVSKPCKDKSWSWNFQNFSLQINMAHSSPQISDGKRM